MPFVSKPDEGSGDVVQPGEVEKLRQELAQAERRIAELKKERASLFDRFRVRVLEIDRDSGKLYTFDERTTRRQEIVAQADATKLIHQERARAGSKDVCFLLLYPRDLTGYPLRGQIESYRAWFRDVPHAIDNPWAAGTP